MSEGGLGINRDKVSKTKFNQKGVFGKLLF